MKAPRDEGTASDRARVRLGAAAQRARIRDAAVLVFAERGVDDTTVEDVISAAQVSRQTFYRCYRGKADLLDAVHRGVTERLVALAAAMGDEELDANEALQRHVKLLFEHAAASGPIVGELEREAMRPDSPFRTHREARLRFSERFLARWVKARAGRTPSAALVHACMLSLDQLWLEVAQSGGVAPRVRRRNERAAIELIEMLLVRTRGR